MLPTFSHQQAAPQKTMPTSKGSTDTAGDLAQLQCQPHGPLPTSIAETRSANISFSQPLL